LKCLFFCMLSMLNICCMFCTLNLDIEFKITKSSKTWIKERTFLKVEQVFNFNPLTSMAAWAGLDFERVCFCLQLFWSPFVPVVFGNVQPIRIHLLRIYLKAWGGPRREDFLSLSEMITFHSKWVPCSVHVNFQDGNISLLEWKIAFWNLKIERRSSKEHSAS